MGDSPWLPWNRQLGKREKIVSNFMALAVGIALGYFIVPKVVKAIS